MNKSDTQSLHDLMAKFKSKVPAPAKTLLAKGGLLEYMKLEEFKQRIKKTKEEYQRKKNA